MEKARIGLVSGIALLACVMNESLATGGRAVVLIAMALIIPLMGNRIRQTRSIWAAIVFVCAWAGFCFLPGGWRTPPDWLLPILPSLPDSENVTTFITPQRWISLQAWLTFVAFLVWGACVTGVHWHTEERKLGLSILTCGAAIIGIVFLYLKFSNTPWPGAAHDDQFGPFANRNQTATLFSLGAVCATGLVLENGKRHWQQTALWCASLGILAAAVTQAGSRAGVLTMATGVLALSGWWSIRSRQLIPLAIGASALLLSFSYLILEGGRLTERLSDSLQGATAEGRLAIWGDASRLIADSPLLGTGLGNFEPAFAQIRSASVSEYHVRHPESDWLWLASEIGIPGTLGLLALIGFSLRKIPLKRLPHVRSRHHLLHITAAIAVFQFIGLSFIDVPAHRIGTLLPAILLLGLAIADTPPGAKRRTPDEEEIKGSPRPNPIMVLCRKVALPAIPALATICWITLPGAHRANNLLEKAALETTSAADSEVSIQRAISIQPLDWRGYFLSANRALSTGPNPREAQRNFQIARTLAPHAPSLPRQEARAWIARGMPNHAIPAWRAQLACDPTRALENYRSMLGAAQDDTDLTRQIVFLGINNPDLQLMSLKRAAKGAAFDALLAEILIAGADLKHWPPDKLADLLELWLARGNNARLEAALTENSRWAKIGWRTHFKLLSSRGDYSQAANLAASHLSQQIQTAMGRSDDATMSEKDISSLRQSFSHSRGDMATGLRLARIEASDGRLSEAIEVLSDLSRIHASSSAPPVLLLKAWCHQQLDQFEQASSAYSDLIEASDGKEQGLATF